MNKRTFLNSLLLTCLLAMISSYSDEFTVEDYALLPNVRSFAISPDGKHVAYIRRGDKGDYLIVGDLESGHRVGGANAESIKARSVYFANNKKVILRGGKTTRLINVRSAWEHSAAILYDLETGKLRTLLNNLERIHPAQSGLGRIVGFNKKENWLLMPAYVNRTSPRYSLARVNVEHGRSRILEHGSRFTTDWFTDSEGQVLAKERYDEQEKLHQIFAKDGNKWRLIFEEKTEQPEISIGAVTPDGTKLVFNYFNEQEDSVFTLALSDGAVDGPLYVEPGVQVKRLITTGLNREFLGVEYSGLMDFSIYIDEKIDAHFRAVSELFPGSSIERVSATEDGSKSIYLVSGNNAANSYYLFDASTMQLELLGQEYPNIDIEHIGEIKAVKYKARDGLSISAVVTWPVGIQKRNNLPLIVLPHGGPEDYDSVRFNWWAQYLARMGYAVLQPNYRGSDGLGIEYRDAGRGQWGRAMQDDISDGIKAMVDGGQVDADRVCIVGASYGGYAALAGAAFTPELYKCAVSIGGVFDVPRMLKAVPFKYGHRHWVVNYWRDVVGDVKNQKQKLKDISPVNFAERVQAPVLLLHGLDDTVVPISQSKAMYKALKKAGKKVELITLKGEDHWLSNSDTRVQTLREISEFLQAYNPPDAIVD